ncbi:exported hypothetical protein [Mesorhizobium sp. STM 4661]|nr:exported hypothetical protein [Mesorhizobium sp. STM 4661]
MVFRITARIGHCMFAGFGRIFLGGVCALLALSGVVLAHHGVTGRYDASAPIVLVGTVAAATFAPPCSRAAHPSIPGSRNRWSREQ